MRRWFDRPLGTVARGTMTGRALGYFDAQWPRMIRVIDDGGLEVHTSLCENAIWFFVFGREGSLFSATRTGAGSSPRLYCQSAPNS